MAGESGYSFSLTTFSPSGKLLQIEHALKAVSSGRTALGLQAADGVVLAVDRSQSAAGALVDADSVERIASITDNIGVVYAGMGPDFRLLVRKGQKKAQAYRLTYGESIPVLELTREIAAIMQEYTQSGGVRPFGVSLLVAGYDDAGPQLYQVDPSGAYFGWRASAIGKNYTNAKTFLEKRYTPEIEVEDAVHTALLTMREGFEGEMTATNIEIGVIGADKKFRVLPAAAVADYLAEAE